MNNILTTNREWKEFFLEDVVLIDSGKRLTKADMMLGNMPFIGASEMNNGITAFTCTTNESLDSNVLGVNYNGSVGFSFYHPYKAIFSDDVKRLRWKDVARNNKYTLLFLSSVIGQQKDKYAYGYKFNAQRMKRQKILLPICIDGTIDWQFMEEYMRLKEKQILKPTIEKLCKQLIDNELSGGGIPSCDWKEFIFGNEFSIESTQSGIDKNKLIQTDGGIPYVTRTDVANGIDMFVCEQSPKYRVDEGNVITIGLDTQTVFYQPAPFYTGQNIQVIRHPKLDRYNAQFLIVAIKKLVKKFSWGSYGATLTRLRKSKIYLPVTSSGEIDFQFMSSFMRQIETDILGTTLNVFRNRLSDNVLNISKLGGVIWKTFNFVDIFQIKKGFYNKKPPCYEYGNIPFIGASDSNNGFTGFTTYSSIEENSKVGYGRNEPIEQKIYKGNAICVTNNGSVGYAYYQQHPFTCTHDVNPLYLKDRELNRHIAMFLISCIEKQRVCFTYARKWRPKRMVKSRLMLPVNADGHPDWDFMEQYMRNVESNELLKIIKHIA